MVDKYFCMSSFLALRYIEKPDMFFKEGLNHNYHSPSNGEEPVTVYSAADIEKEFIRTMSPLEGEKIGLLLSGGMDSAIVASFMPGKDAYTFRYEDGFQSGELKRAQQYANQYGLKLHYVDITWSDFVQCTPHVIKTKGAPVHSIEPQIYKAALQAKQDGVTKLLVGESADLLFGGMDKLLSKDWTVEEFKERYTFVNPAKVLKNPVSMNYLFERYCKGNKFDTLAFMDNVFSIESSSSYYNAFKAANMPYFDPFAHLRMGDPLDLARVRRGESKYLIRELFAMRYPSLPVPEKIPMPRQVDKYFKDWSGPTRNEFVDALDMSSFTGEQKWLIYVLEWFLNTL